MTPSSMVELDGSFGEGGGQILRTSLALSLITGRPFHLRNVRAGRSKPGLQPQHLMSVRAAATIGHANLRGASKGSTDLVFEPGQVVPGKYHFAIGTAGATGLVLHTIYLPLALTQWESEAPAEPVAAEKLGVQTAQQELRPPGRLMASEITIEGGTHVTHAPCFHFLETTWAQYMALLGLKVGLKMRRPGFYPRGGGLVEAVISPMKQLQAWGDFRPTPGQMVRGFSAVAGLPEEIARRQARRATKRLRDSGLQVDIQEEMWPGGPGTVLGLTLDTRPVPTFFFGLGERGKRAERVADEAVDQLLHFHQGAPAVDQHSADQILLTLALADKPSTYPVAEITSHLLTNAAVIGHFFERGIQIEGNEGAPGTVRIGEP